MSKNGGDRRGSSGAAKPDAGTVAAVTGRWFWWAATAAGLILRFALLPAGTRHGYLYDHDDFVRWGIQATDHGLATLYQGPPPRSDMQRWTDGRWVTTQRTLDRVCNYPPLSTYLLYASGLAFQAVSDDRLINTLTSRAIFSFWSILGDVLTAWGCAALVARFRPGPAGPWTFLGVLFAPPLWWDSAVWGQMDAIIMAPTVWMLWAMCGRRWLLAGVLYGAAAALKPQAVLFLPVWALAVATARPFWRPLVAAPVAALVVAAASLPYLLHDGFTWFHRSYVENLLHAYTVTTLKAFNLWYVDLLRCDSADSAATWLGVSKDLWGKGFLLAGLAAGFAWTLWRWRHRPQALVLWSGVSLLLLVMLPTRVHERYLVVVTPFLVVTAVLWKRFWPGLLLLAITATAQVSWPSWLTEPAGNWTAFERRLAAGYEAQLAAAPPEHRDRFPSLEEYLEPARKQYQQRRSDNAPFEWLFTALALAGTAAVLTAFVSLRPEPDRPAAAERWGP